MIHFLSLTAFPVLMIVAGAGDVLSLRIPNWLTGLIAVLFVPMAFAAAMPLGVFGMHLLTGFGMLMAGFALFAFGLFGGGDAKLLAAAGLWFGWPDALPFLILTVFAGGVLALCVAVWSSISLSSEIHDGWWTKRITAVRPNVPYGYALAAGAILAFPQSWWMPAVTI